MESGYRSSKFKRRDSRESDQSVYSADYLLLLGPIIINLIGLLCVSSTSIIHVEGVSLPNLQFTSIKY